MAKKQQDEGFTLIELLVTFVIIGTLAAIALPSFLNQSAKAKQAEAKNNVGVINRTQIAHRTEHSSFATAFDVLGIGTLTGGDNATTTSYSYTIAGGTDTATIVATSLETSLKAYSGGNSRDISISNDTVIFSILCEANTPGTSAAVPPTVSSTGAPTCNSYKDLSQ